MSTYLIIAFLLILLCGLLMNFAWLYRMHIGLRMLFRGKKAADLEEVMTDMARTLDALLKQQHRFSQELQDTARTLEGAIQRVGIVRFNPFGDSGGDQSFAIALLNDAHDGIVLSSLYARDGVRVFAKPVSHAESPYRLSREEVEAVRQATSS